MPRPLDLEEGFDVDLVKTRRWWRLVWRPWRMNAPVAENDAVRLLDGPQGPLKGYRVIELCSTIAGPACTRLLADFGAEVIKVEPAAGDPVRDMASYDGDVSLYGASIFRNKKLISLNIKTDEGKRLLLSLIAKSDIVVENFRPGTLERLGLGYDVLSRSNSALVMVRISGYGQTGPLALKPGYGAICEAFAGLRHLTGEPDRPPARVAVPVTDYMTAVYAAFGAVMALMEAKRSGHGQVIDAALYEAAYSIMESTVPVYDRTGIVPMRSGSRLPGAAPNSLYKTKEGAYVLIGANNDAVFGRLANAMGRPDLIDDPRYATVRARGQNADEVDAIVERWVAEHTVFELVDVLEQASVPSSLVNTVADLFKSGHFRERDMLLKVPHEKLGHLTVAGVVPKLSRTPGSVYRLGGDVGADTADVLSELLGLSPEVIGDLASDGHIALCSGHEPAELGSISA